MKNKGMLVSLYRSDYNSTLNKCFGVDRVILVGEKIPEIFEISDKIAVELKLKRFGTDKYWYCEPVKPPHNETQYMFGGTFVYTSDSRFPSDYPIPLHDRSEFLNGIYK